MFQISIGADFGMLVLKLNLRQPRGNSYAIHCPFDDLPYQTVPFPSHMILMDSLQTQLSSDSLSMVLVFYQIIHCSLYVDMFVLLGYKTYQMER